MLHKIAKYSFSSVSQKQMLTFSKHTNWWHPAGPSQLLFAYNYHRISFLRKYLNQSSTTLLPLAGMKILDVGCGAGFLCESLARLGGDVVGLDPSATSFGEASTHKRNRKDLENLQYYNESLEQFMQRSENLNRKFDIVTSMEVIEHVTNPLGFVQSLSNATKADGLVMMSTIRRSPSTWFSHIFMAQKIMGIVPDGTHHHNQFINPDQCVKMMRSCGLQNEQILELDVGWSGEFEQKKGGGNYLIIAKKQGRIEEN